jgi:hypothetical protein
LDERKKALKRRVGRMDGDDVIFRPLKQTHAVEVAREDL